MSEKIKIEVYVSTGLVGSRNSTVEEFDREEWEGMSCEEKDEACKDIMLGLIEWDFKEVE